MHIRALLAAGLAATAIAASAAPGDPVKVVYPFAFKPS